MNILFALCMLLVTCLSLHKVSGEACYNQLGCFPDTFPWTSSLRPFPSPETPTKIDTKMTLYTRIANNGYKVRLWPSIDTTGSDYIPIRPRTVFIITDFPSDETTSLMRDLMMAYLKRVETNVFIVEWGRPSNTINYLQAASNARIAGAELGRFINNSLQSGLNLDNVHLIGHGLGSHVSSYAAKWFSSTSKKVARLTALDPSGPGFEYNDPLVRLDQNDAYFIDILHSNSGPFLPFFGLGMMSSIGHVDFYLNGGPVQPGCQTPDFNPVSNISSVSDLGNVTAKVLLDVAGCSHTRAVQVYISSLINGKSCTLWGKKTKNLVEDLAYGFFSSSDDYVPDCRTNTCNAIGLETSLLPARGIFYTRTSSNTPYCENNGNLTDRHLQLMQNLVISLVPTGPFYK